MLRLLRGRAHQVLTAFALRGPAASAAAFADVVVTEVDVVAFSEDLMEQYVACGEWRGKAGAYAIQGIGAALVAGVRGSVTNVIGLPLAEVVAQLARLGGPGPCFTQGQAE